MLRYKDTYKVDIDLKFVNGDDEDEVFDVISDTLSSVGYSQDYDSYWHLIYLYDYDFDSWDSYDSGMPESFGYIKFGEHTKDWVFDFKGFLEELKQKIKEHMEHEIKVHALISKRIKKELKEFKEMYKLEVEV